MLKKLPLPLKILLYELFPHLYLEPMEYRLEGYCCKCGDCCRYIMCPGPFAWLDFKLVGLLFPKYRRFKIIGKDKYGNLILACKLIRESGKCPDYENRPALCRDFPEKTYTGSMLYKRCTYKLIPKKSFSSYLK